MLGGHQSNAVTLARITKSRVLGARWPATFPARLPTMKPGELLTTTSAANDRCAADHLVGDLVCREQTRSVTNLVVQKYRSRG